MGTNLLEKFSCSRFWAPGLLSTVRQLHVFQLVLLHPEVLPRKACVLAYIPQQFLEQDILGQNSWLVGLLDRPNQGDYHPARHDTSFHKDLWKTRMRSHNVRHLWIKRWRWNMSCWKVAKRRRGCPTRVILGAKHSGEKEKKKLKSFWNFYQVLHHWLTDRLTSRCQCFCSQNDIKLFFWILCFRFFRVGTFLRVK